MRSKEATTRPGISWTFRGALGIAAEGNIDFAGISIRNPAVFPRIPSESRVSFVPILIEWMKRGGKIGRNAPFSAFSRASANGTGLTVSEVKPKANAVTNNKKRLRSYSYFVSFCELRIRADRLWDLIESGQRESNPHGQLGRLELYH